MKFFAIDELIDKLHKDENKYNENSKLKIQKFNKKHKMKNILIDTHLKLNQFYKNVDIFEEKNNELISNKKSYKRFEEDSNENLNYDLDIINTNRKLDNIFSEKINGNFFLNAKKNNDENVGNDIFKDLKLKFPNIFKKQHYFKYNQLNNLNFSFTDKVVKKSHIFTPKKLFKKSKEKNKEHKYNEFDINNKFYEIEDETKYYTSNNEIVNNSLKFKDIFNQSFQKNILNNWETLKNEIKSSLSDIKILREKYEINHTKKNKVNNKIRINTQNNIIFEFDKTKSIIEMNSKYPKDYKVNNSKVPLKSCLKKYNQ
jgi:hypothetical protein